MNPNTLAAVLLFAGAVCFFVGSAINLWMVLRA